ncbi:SLATT domain-containing protein [Cryobacterium tagatosivorans]|uniref:SLATT domain-containing protein n=1 Tax=Cryobacterium tagatosivorans TaxID=1259199 RepID=UPI00141AF168|nr:SLATT domain-containing protein [Cryobacterium tagatosivorans]
MRYKEPIEALAKRSFASYLARLNAEKRLRKVGQWWNAAQFCLSTALVSVSIVFLAFPEKQAPVIAVLLVILAVLALVVSLVVTFLDYSARAKAMFGNYRSLQTFSVKTETLVQSRARITGRQLRALQTEYNSIMDTSENHSPMDHKVAQALRGVHPFPVNLVAATAKPVLLPILLIVVSLVTVAVSIWAIA